ncbi:tRNA (adenosine(37)-N6)-threonylcarbamoyltransferase complex ATPase subunit type 1 TsaE [Donghicola sp. XS_ASV15]|uniref:tRNA (adenosine(37)-N6)-threonylcarbamoyltransferase complex ATPase subunit type 1 TsaE n=1 Tax=Donghicola sp. XS_ASV15 TaxID=3241295 RepID=UPI00351786DB
MEKQFDLSSPEATQRFAETLAPLLAAGDVLLLEGPIGAGKTHFARSLIQALLTEPEDIPSPTFTIVQVYDGPNCEIWHSDLYRLSHPDEAIELGLEDAFETAICLIEWPDRLGEAAPDQALRIAFEVGNDLSSRRVTVALTSPTWRAKLEGLS